jgi:glycosyltransferase involved in cell wall biosynthesis
MMVSVLMLTYNHQDFIAQAIEGVLSQKTTFDIELIIANDYSTDNTDSIIKKIIEKDNNAKEKIKYINNSKNIGMQPNFILAYNHCKGKYIAECEGDDYWTDPYKLQKQVDFLESNPEYAITFHKVKIYNEIKEKFEEDTLNTFTNETTTLNDLLRGNYIRTVSTVFRNSRKLASLIEKLNDVTPGDWLVFIVTASTGKIRYINQEMAVYRVSYVGVWSTIDNKQRKYYKEILNGYEFLYNYLNKDDYTIVYHSHMHYIGLAAIINKEKGKYLNYYFYKALLYYRLLRFKYFSGSRHLAQ